MRACTKCQIEYPQTDEFFYKSARASSGLREQCKTCVRAYNASGGWVNHIRRKYGITPDFYYSMLEGQGGKCALCGLTEDKKLHVDHCHATGKVRSLLCTNCNRAIGYAQENPDTLRKMADYIESWNEIC